ncbi:hypothetical protein MAR_029521 [Mya arenaria]|uniref:Odorant receptor n=1 Tax=Mya arenaria TaxID=6604 RepID=A0ABY7DJQ0_MYAAR|nr:hypothetical protein MAR_029521 [Mya arenaria]
MPATKVHVLPASCDIGEEGESSGIQASFRSFLTCMKITGLHHLKRRKTNGGKIWKRLAWMYRLFVPGVLLANFVFSMGEFRSITSFDAYSLDHMIASISFLQVTLFSLNNIIRGRRWDRFYKAWDEYTEVNKIETSRWIRKFSLAVMWGYFIWIATAAGFLALNMSNPRQPSGFAELLPDSLMSPVMVFTSIAYFFCASTSFLLTAQFILTCTAICRVLHVLYRAMCISIEHDDTLKEKMEMFRQQHEKCCRIISLADDVLSVFTLVTVFTTIPLIVITLYFVLFDKSEVETLAYAATCWSITLSVLQLTVIFLFGGAVNYMAHRPATLLYGLDLNRTAQLSVQQLGVFLTRLTSQPIGMTAFGLFVLDKPTIFTFVGSIMTYAIVMIQFKPGDNTCPITCNCTEHSKQHKASIDADRVQASSHGVVCTSNNPSSHPGCSQKDRAAKECDRGHNGAQHCRMSQPCQLLCPKSLLKRVLSHDVHECSIFADSYSSGCSHSEATREIHKYLEFSMTPGSFDKPSP